jgi:hypothetical protein
MLPKNSLQAANVACHETQTKRSVEVYMGRNLNSPFLSHPIDVTRLLNYHLHPQWELQTVRDTTIDSVKHTQG